MLPLACEESADQPDEQDRSTRALQFEKRSQRHFNGLNETVTVVKGLGGGHVVRADGRRQSLWAVKEEDSARWREQHGTLTPEVVNYSSVVDPIEIVPVAILFNPLADWDAYFDAQESGDASEAADQAQALQDGIASAGADIVAELANLGITAVETDVWAPIIQAEVPAFLLQSVGEIPGIARIIGNGESEAIEHADNVVEPTTFHQKSSLSGYNGAAKIGIIDPGTCKVRSTHTMVSAVVNYSNAGASCSNSAQCNVANGPCGGNGPSNTCVSGKCLDGHGNAVTSVATRFAPDSVIYYPNMGTLPKGPACAREITAAYNYLQASGVRFVNESFSCDDHEVDGLSPTDGVVQDFFSREHDFLITKAAGNDGQGSEACRNTWNSVCVGSVDAEAQYSCFSSVDNPMSYISTAIDREEPDVMAVGGQKDCSGSSEQDTVTLAGTGSNTQVVYGVGTSFSAPAILGMSVLVDQYCNAQGRSLTSVDHRALARNAGYGGNPDGWAFSTPKPGQDHDDGGGVVYLSKLKRVCDASQPGDDEHGLISQRINPTTGGNTTPLPSTDPEYDDAPPQSVPLDQDLKPSGQTGYHWQDLWAGMSTTFDAGDRVRVNFSWEACVLDADPAAERTVPTDFDLFLYNSTTGKGLYSSQSDDDVNEGFDVVIPTGWDGDYDLLLIWPDGSVGCDGGERTSLAYWIKRD